MGFFSSIADTFKSTVAKVSSAINTAKEYAGKALAWVANNAESLVVTVKETWKIVKPYVEKARVVIKTVATLTATTIPWLSGALIALDKGIEALTAFENSPIAKKITQAIEWAIKIAKQWQSATQQENDCLSQEDLQIAKKHQENIRFFERETMSEEQRHNIGLTSSINDFVIAKTEIANAIDKEPVNFEHYLRLRAAQKLLTMANEKFRSAKTIDDLSADDIFLNRVSSDLVKEKPEMSNEAALKLDRILAERYGKKLLPFVFEELVASWSKNAEAIGNNWATENKFYTKDSVLLKRLELANKTQNELSKEEAKMLETLRESVPKHKKELDEIATKQHDMERYVGAAEGLLQLLEKSEDQIRAEEREYLIEDGALVGKLIVDCAQKNIPFSKLNKEDQSTITRYANIFKTDSKKRMKKVLEVTA